jgi:hypothetical protein
MGFAVGVAFLVAGAILIALCLLAILRIGFGRLESHIGIERDGPRRPSPVPHWRLPDLEGVVRSSPTHGRWQLLIFADQSLAYRSLLRWATISLSPPSSELSTGECVPSASSTTGVELAT